MATSAFSLPSIIQSLVKGGGIQSLGLALSRLNPYVATATVILGGLTIALKKHNEESRLTSLGYNLTEDAIHTYRNSDSYNYVLKTFGY